MPAGISWGSTLSFVVDKTGLILQTALWGLTLYYLFISMFGWIKRKEVPASSFPAVNRFAVIVAAHNEEKVVGGVIRSLKALKYPKELYDIYVIADNCTDNTAKVAAENGALVHERFDEARKGKGFSMEWMFKRLFEMDKQYDAIAIFDADNLASPNFLMEMNKRLLQGHKVIQGYLDSKNPHDSWISGNYAISYWISNRIFQLPRYYLGLNCGLGGTGFVMATDVIKKFGWGATCLTEDLEFSLKLVLNGMKVSWSHEAVIYDEKPLKLKQSWRQRKRWMQGHCDCASRYLKKLFVKALKERDMVSLDSCVYLIQPFIIVANGVSVLFGVFKYISSFEFNMYTILFTILVVFVTYLSIIFVMMEGKLDLKIFAYFITYPLYSITWIPIIIQGFIHRKQKVWVHTEHTKALDISDIENFEKIG